MKLDRKNQLLAKVRRIKIGHGPRSIVKIAFPQVCRIKVCKSKRCMGKARAIRRYADQGASVQDRVRKVGVGKVCPIQLCLHKIGFAQIGLLKVCLRKVSAFQDGTGKISITEIGSRKICPCEVLVFKGRPPEGPPPGQDRVSTRRATSPASNARTGDITRHERASRAAIFHFFLLIPLIPLLAAAAFPVLWAKSQ